MPYPSSVGGPYRIDTRNPVSNHPLNRGLVSCWVPMPNNSGGSKLFDVIRGNHGTLTNGPTWGTGYGGFGGVVCDGTNDYVAISVPHANVTSGFSIAILFRADYAAGITGASTHSFLSIYGQANENFGITWRHDNSSYAGAFYMKGSGAYPVVTWSPKPVANTWTLVTGDWDGSTMESFVQGISQGTTSNSTFGSTSNTNLAIGSGNTSGGGEKPTQGTIGGAWLWNRRRLATEQWSFYEQFRRGFPDVFRRIPSRVWSFGGGAGGGGGSYSLAMDAGSYGLTGQDVGLKASRQLAYDAGSYSLTGQDVSLKSSRQLAVASGSYTLTGQDVALKASRQLASDAGSYALTGQDVALKASRQLAHDAGSYALTGQDVGLKADRQLANDAGSYALTGQDVALTYSGASGSYTLAVEAGSYALTGSDVGLVAARVLGIASDSYGLTGSAVALLAARQIAALSGSYTFTGQDVTFTYSPVSVDLLSGLGAYYRLDNDLTDSSGNGRDLSASGTPTYAAAKLNTGLTTNSGTYALSGWLTGTNAASVSFWIKGVAAFDGVGGQVGDGNQFVIRYDSDSGSGGFLTFQGNPVNSPGDFVAGTWYNVAVTYAGGTLGAIKAYINGTLAYTDTGTINWDTTLTVNATGDQSSPLDEVAVYTRAITAAEVSALYNSGLGYDPTNVGPVSRLTIAGTDRSRVTIPGTDRSRVTVAGTLRN